MNKRWTTLLIGGVVIAVVVAAGTSAWAMNGGDDDRPATTSDTRDEGAPAGDGASSACLEGATDCADNPGGGALGMCVEGVTDCVDVVVDPGGTMPACPETGCEAEPPPAEACAADACIDPVACPEEIPYEECVRYADEQKCAQDGLGNVRCFPEPCVDVPVPGEPAIEPACPPVTPPDNAPPTDGDLPPDCAVSSDGEISCPDVDGGGDGGAGSAPGAPPSDDPGVTEPGPGE
jgi:hypothetical protein